MGRYDLDGGDEVVAGGSSGLGEEPQSAEGLGVGGPLTARDQDLMNLRSASILSTLVWTTSGLPDWK